ncbi:cell division protein ZipA [Azomonas macrocytogenes]|nr:cell division protein ZipA [Azomonas macrocytogenes]
MEIGLREWLIVVGIVVIVVILFDGWRRMRGGKGKLKFQLERNVADQQEEDSGENTDELLGPARIVRQQDPTLDIHDMPSLSTHGHQRSHSSESSKHDEYRIGTHNETSSMRIEPIQNDHFHDYEEKEEHDKSGPSPIEEVLVINVISREPTGFRGPALLQNILESGLRFGEMDIFHRHESMTGNGEILFSMANAVKPGTFDLDDIDHFTTRAVSFFLGLPGPRHPKQAFDLMIAAARKLSQELSGELKDDQRSVLTAQTIEHYRQRIAEFERRQMTLKR